MALDFAARIHALTGFDADSTENTETDDDFDESAAQWMTDAAKEVINILPSKLKEKCAAVTDLNNIITTLDLDGIGNILQVTRLSADSGGYYIPCRQVHPMYGDLTNDSTSIHYATRTDPAYWKTSNSSDVSTLFVKPTPTSSQPAIVYHVSYPLFTAGTTNTDDNSTYDISVATTIANFPDEAENLVVLRASITAAEYQLAIEEDYEVYGPIIATLKIQYQEGVQALQTGTLTSPQKKGDK